VPRPPAPTLSRAHHRLGRRLAAPHLPQGAPTSPALANLAAFTLDRRLTGLAGALDATYTRYADDLTLSGSSRLLHQSERIRDTIATIAREEGFALNTRKSVVTTRAGRQQVCGIVVNERLNMGRREYDELKAIVHNAARRGPSGENHAGVPDFRAHLLGRTPGSSRFTRPGHEAAQRVRPYRLGPRACLAAARHVKGGSSFRALRAVARRVIGRRLEGARRPGRLTASRVARRAVAASQRPRLRH